ncbi:BA14K family protein [Bradyrhizobium sp. BRP14]|nr:BA14K family protein [Bradyrhizobium sp. BRP14]
MTRFRNFVISCAVAATSIIPTVAPAQAMPRPVLDIASTAPADLQNVTHRGRYGWGGPRFYGGWGNGFYPGWHRHRRSGISLQFNFGPSYPRYYPGRYYYGNRYYYGPRYYGPGYYPGYYPRRYYRPSYYGHRYYRPGYYGGAIVRGW